MQQNETSPIMSITSDDDFDITFLRTSSSYDGHSLRAFSYWGHLMPEISQATDEEQCFQVGETSFKATDTINHNGHKYTGLEFYEKYGEIHG